MAITTDFEVITFNAHLGDRRGDVDVPGTTFYGDLSPEKSFYIRDRPVGDAYLLLQAYDVDHETHRILINGSDLGGVDIRRDGNWQTWMDVIEAGVLRQGNNTIQFRRAPGGDNFVIMSVAIHWKESSREPRFVG